MLGLGTVMLTVRTGRVTSPRRRYITEEQIRCPWRGFE
jgi:hypothetical protein